MVAAQVLLPALATHPVGHEVDVEYKLHMGASVVGAQTARVLSQWQRSEGHAVWP